MKRKYGEYNTLKEARAAARQAAFYTVKIPIYKEPDNSYSINFPFHKKAVLICGIDKSGRRYEATGTQTVNIDGHDRNFIVFEPVKKEKKRN